MASGERQNYAQTVLKRKFPLLFFTLLYCCSVNFCSFIGRRHHHIVENPNKKPNAGEHIQPLQIANHQRQEDDQDVVADGPDPLPQAVQIEPNTARAQGNIRDIVSSL